MGRSLIGALLLSVLLAPSQAYACTNGESWSDRKLHMDRARALGIPDEVVSSYTTAGPESPVSPAGLLFCMWESSNECRSGEDTPTLLILAAATVMLLGLAGFLLVLIGADQFGSVTHVFAWKPGMETWVVRGGSESPQRILGVFTTEYKARKFKKYVMCGQDDVEKRYRKNMSILVHYVCTDGMLAGPGTVEVDDSPVTSPRAPRRASGKSHANPPRRASGKSHAKPPRHHCASDACEGMVPGDDSDNSDGIWR